MATGQRRRQRDGIELEVEESDGGGRWFGWEDPDRRRRTFMACRAAFMVTTRRDRHTSLHCRSFFFDSNQPAAPARPYFFHDTTHIPNHTLVILPPERDHRPYFSILAFSFKKNLGPLKKLISSLDHGVDRYHKL